MFGLDKWLENKLKTRFHQKKNSIVDKSLADFQKRYPFIDSSVLRAKLENENHRIYPIVDRSIIRDRIQRADYVFWMTATVSVIFVGSLGGFFSGSFWPFAAPLLSSLVAWTGSIATIPISYFQRVKGAMDSVTNVYENSLCENPSLENASQPIRLSLSSTAIIHENNLLHFPPTSDSHYIEIPEDSFVSPSDSPNDDLREEFDSGLESEKKLTPR